jgi:putative hydrolase of the HAD superfamily
LKVGVLSDTDPIHGQHIASHPILEKTVESWTFSYTAQTVKPTEEIYLAALASMETPPESTLFIDDRIKNVRGAQSVGIHGILYEDRSTLIHQLDKLGL